ncbi:MAG: PqqD family protein [Caldilineaceae bacterium]|nr:PqqD family protein [Caldilineaceae bacterium]
MNLQSSYRVNGPKVVHELFDDEAVVVDLDSGNYYSTEGVGALIWQAMLAGQKGEQIVSEVQARYEADDSEAQVAVTQFLESLEGEGLIVAVAADSQPGNGDALLGLGVAPAGGRLPFAPPLLNRFTDMQDLLLLDPIHEVDESGWPNLPGEPA